MLLFEITRTITFSVFTTQNTESKNDLKSYRNTGFVEEINPKDKYILLSEV